MGVCLVPYAASRHRADLQYRMIDDEHATSPVILSHRRNDDSPYLALIKALLQEMYAGAPVWLDSGKASDDGSRQACKSGAGPSRSRIAVSTFRPKTAFDPKRRQIGGASCREGVCQ